MDCARCNEPNPRVAKFCLNCGWRLAACPVCGSVEGTASGCPACGGTRPLGSAAAGLRRSGGRQARAVLDGRIGERKQVTVLFVDTVQSTVLIAGLGPEVFRELMNELFALARSEVERFGGLINQLLGDGFMAIFGALAAQEDHTRRAVLAAHRLRARVRDTLLARGVELRVGIASGLAVIDTVGEGAAAGFTAFGEVTVLAARLQAHARPGEILVTRFEADRVRDMAQLDSLGELVISGQVVQTESVRSVNERRATAREPKRLLAPFTGRQVELKALLERIPEVQGGRGLAVHVVGDPGAGKSRLVLELMRASSARVVEGRCLSYGSAMPYLPVADLVRQTCGVLPEDPVADVVPRIRDELGRIGLEEAALPLLLDVTGHRRGMSGSPELDPATVKGRTFDTLREFWRAESRVAPLVLVVEDVHWIDPTSEEFLSFMIDSLGDERMLLVLTQRPGYQPPWRDRPRVSTLELRALPDEASRTIVAATLPTAMAQTGLDAIVSRGEGNPFFLEELARASVEGDPYEVPHTVQDVLAARLGRLGYQAKLVAQTAAVLGRDFSMRVLRDMWPGPSALGPLVRQLEDLGVLAARRRRGVREFGFKHALTHEVAYASLLERQRRELHGRAGAVLEALHATQLEEHCELIAHHYARSSETAKAAEFLVKANRRAASRNAMEEALAYFYQALRALEALEDSDAQRRRRLQLVFDQTGEFHFLHRHQEYYDLILAHEPLVRLVDDERLWGAFQARLGHRQWTSGQVALSVATLERAAATCSRFGDDEHGPSAHAILGWAHLMCGNYAAVPHARDQALAMLTRRFDPVWLSFARAAAIMACTWSGRWSAAVEEGTATVRDARARGDRATASFNTSWIAHAYLLQGDWAKAREHALVALAEAPTIYFRGFPQAMLARAMCGLGDAAGGVEILAQIEPMVRASGHQPAWALIAGMLGEACLAAGDARSARTVLESVNAAGRAAPMSFLRVQSSRLLGQIALEEGRYADAGRWLDDALAEGRRSEAANEVALTVAAQGHLARATGDRATACGKLREALQMLLSLDTLEEPARLSRELEALAG